jgi:hypothetical protein
MSDTAQGDSGSITVRVSGHGQFKVNKGTLNKIDTIDDAIVGLIERSSSSGKDETQQAKELREKLSEIVSLVTGEGKRLDDKDIVQSDVIIPDNDISIEEARKIFKGEGVVTEA